MKKLIMLSLLAVAFSSCEKDPDLSKLDSDFTVYTQFDEQADFASATTFYLPDSILTVGNGLEAVYWKDDNAKKLIAQVADEMGERGYTRSEEKEKSDFGLQMTYVESNMQVTDWVGGWYNSWWNPGFWGPYWGGWYYPYPVSYQYNTGTIVMELVDLTAAEEVAGKSGQQLPVIWRATSSGLLSNNNHINLMLVQRAIEQSFQQSTYINKK